MNIYFNRLSRLFPDFLGGFSAMLVALPSAIGFGLIVYSPLGKSAAAEGAIAGIIGTILMGLIAPILGGTPRLVSAPCGPAAAVLVVLVTELMNTHSYPVDWEFISSMIMMVIFLAGIMQLIFGLFGGGKLIKFIPYPVVAGYLNSVGILIFLGQLPKFLGVSGNLPLLDIISTPSLWNIPALAIGSVTILTMILAPRVTRLLPAVILALFCGIIFYFILGFTWYPDLLSLNNNSYVIGNLGHININKDFIQNMIHRWLPNSQTLSEELHFAFAPALTLAVLLSIDTLKTCVVLDTLTRSRHNSNRELLGQGVGNIASGMLGGLASSGTMGPTLVNVSSGGHTRMSGTFVGILSLFTFLVLGNFVAWVPLSALSGILIVISIKMIDRSSLKLFLNKSTLLDFLVIFSVVVTAVTSSLITATIVGLGLAILLFLREQIKSSVIRNKFSGNQLFSKRRRLPEANAILAAKGSKTVILELQGSLFFGTTDQLLSELTEPLSHAHYIILDFKRVKSLDFTAIHMLEQVEDKLTEKNRWLLFSDLPATLPTGQDVKSYLNDAGLVRAQGNLKIFPELNDAMEWAEDNVLESNGYDVRISAPPLALDKINLFSGLKKDAIQLINQSITSKSYMPGEKIFSSGDRGDELFFVRKGQVRVLLPINKHKKRLLASIGRGDFFGDIAFLDKGLRSADAVASTPCEVFILSRKNFKMLAEKHPDIAASIFERLAYALAFRLRFTDSELSILEQS